MTVDLVRDLLDKKVVDRNGRELGRVDGVILDIHNGFPRLAAIELGPTVLAFRVHPLLGRFMAALEHAFGVDDGRPVRLPMSAVLEVEPQIKADIAFGDTAATAVERKLRRFVSRIPGS